MWTDQTGQIMLTTKNILATKDREMIGDLLKNNAEWVKEKTRSETGFFSQHSEGQSPEYLWIGCSDSRVPANDISGLGLGELFVHRNVANIANPSDPSFSSVLQYAIDALKVKHIIICGHYGCGGVAASLTGANLKHVDDWIYPIRETAANMKDRLKLIADEQARINALCEINVAMQVRSVASNRTIQDAWKREQSVSVHGLIYSIKTGLLTDLELTTSSDSDLAESFPKRFSALLDEQPR